MHGPGTKYSPAYSTIPNIVVYDGIAPGLRPRKRRRWREKRDKGLAMWDPTGLRFIVSELPEPEIFTGIGNPVWGGAVSSEMVGVLRPDVITLAQSTYNGGGYNHAWALPWWYGGSAVFMNLRRITLATLAGSVLQTWPRTFAHEIGHCLGLTHDSGGKSIMGGRGLVPNAHDINSVKDYFRV